MASQWQRWKGIMKCYPFEEKRLAKWEPPYIVQPKYDGVRCRSVFMAHNQSTMLLSSEENVIFSVPHIVATLNKLMLTAELDGELYCHGMSFQNILSITSRSVNLHPEYEIIKFHIFDVVNEEPQMRRQLIVEALRGIHPLLEIAPFHLCEDLDAVKRAYDNLIESGYEGIIIRHKMGPYLKKRSIWVMKFKPKKKDTYDIVGWNEEVSKDGVPKGRIGSLIMASQSGDTFGVSAGLNDESRARFWEIRDELAGKKAVVHYQHLTDKKIPKGTFNLEVIE